MIKSPLSGSAFFLLPLFKYSIPSLAEDFSEKVVLIKGPADKPNLSNPLRASPDNWVVETPNSNPPENSS